MLPFVSMENSKIGKSVYVIDNKHEIEVKDLIFSVNLYKNYIIGFDDNKLLICFSSDTDMPIGIFYVDSDIRVYLFQ